MAEVVAWPILKKSPFEQAWAGDKRGPISYGFALSLAGAALAGVLLRMRRLAHHRPRNRMKRLNRLASRSDTLKRAPHRLMERALRHHAGRSGPPLKLMRAVGPGHVILINGPDTGPIGRARALRTAFEPVELGLGDERIDDLFEMDEDPRDTPKASTAEPARTSIRHRLSGAMVKALPAMAAILLLADALRKMAVDPAWRTVCLAALTVVLVIWLAPRVDICRRWWIAPGMLITRLVVPWRRESIDVLGPATSALLLDFRHTAAFVRRGGRTQRLNSDTASLCALLIAWVSEAPQPSREQIELLLSGRSESEGSPGGAGRVGAREQT